jgi:hypothetical protein
MFNTTTARNSVDVRAVDRTQPDRDFLPEDKVIMLTITSHVGQGGILSSSETAFSLEETIMLIEKLSSGLAEATKFSL